MYSHQARHVQTSVIKKSAPAMASCAGGERSASRSVGPAAGARRVSSEFAQSLPGQRDAPCSSARPGCACSPRSRSLPPSARPSGGSRPVSPVAPASRVGPFLGHELSLPPQQGIGCHDRGDLRQCPPSHLKRRTAKPSSVGIGKTQARRPPSCARRMRFSSMRDASASRSWRSNQPIKSANHIWSADMLNTARVCQDLANSGKHFQSA